MEAGMVGARLEWYLKLATTGGALRQPTGGGGGGSRDDGEVAGGANTEF